MGKVRGKPARLPGHLVLPLSVALLWGPSALAGSDQGAVAEALFQSGRELMAAGKYVEACPKFAESNRIDPKLGTLMNLALCHENEGKPASAWAEYVQAANVAKRAGQEARERVARERASALEPTLPRLLLDAGPAPAGADVAVTLDDQPIRAAAFGTPIPLDPGDHTVRATATGKTPFVESFVARTSDPLRTVHIPPLASGEPAPTPPASAVRGESTTDGGASPLRTWAWVLGGAGVAAVGVGAFFGVSAFSEKNTVSGECSPARCTPAGDDAKASLGRDETVSTIAMIGGAAMVGAGVWLWLLGRSHDASAQRGRTLRMAPDFAARGVRLELRW